MKRIIALAVAFVLTAAALSSCAKPAEKEPEPAESEKVSGDVLVISRLAGQEDSSVSFLKEKFEALGATVKTQSYAEIAEAGLDKSADVIVNASGNEFAPSILDSIGKYVENGGNYLAIGNNIFSSKVHLSNGKYITEDEILKNGNKIFSPETDGEIDGLQKDSDTTSAYPDTYSLDDYGSGYGKSLKVTTGLLRSKNTVSFPVSIGDENALILRYRPTHSYSEISVMLTLEDGSQYYYNINHSDNSDEWRNITIYAEDFLPCTESRTENFTLSQAKSLTFGFIKKIGNYSTGIGIIYYIDSIAAFRADKPDRTEYESTVNRIFPRSYCEKYSERKITNLSYGSDHIGSVNLSEVTLDLGFVFEHGELNPGGNTTRIQSLLSDGNGDIAWICDRANGGRVAVIGSDDGEFLEKIGYSLAAEAVLRMLKPSAITGCPKDLCYCTESGNLTLNYTYRVPAEETNFRLSVSLSNADGDILADTDISEKDENGNFRVCLTVSPDKLTVSSGDSVTATAVLTVGGGNTEADRAQASITVITERKVVTFAAVGDSITYGSGTEDPMSQSYPKQMEEIPGEIKIVSENYGLRAGSALLDSDLPYTGSELYTDSLNTKADYIFILFGANDVDRWASGGRESFREDYTNLVRQYMSLEQKPQVILGISLPKLDSDTAMYYMREEPDTSIKAMIESIAEELSLPTIDLYPHFVGGEETVMDERIHPNATGYGIIAHLIYDKITELERD